MFSKREKLSDSAEREREEKDKEEEKEEDQESEDESQSSGEEEEERALPEKLPGNIKSLISLAIQFKEHVAVGPHKRFVVLTSHREAFVGMLVS